ncbi:MAG TPA: RDD family protein [Jatrophihabitans sp.]|nr:RDD family protein [Jatrophihabitans sp.]
MPQTYRGAQLGLPAEGSGALAPFNRRLGAFLLDLLISALVAAVIVRGVPGQWSLIPWALDYIIGMLLFGRTAGMAITGLRIIRVDANEAIGPVRAVLRTGLLVLLVPGLIVDADLRGLQDRLTSTAVITA